MSTESLSAKRPNLDSEAFVRRKAGARPAGDVKVADADLSEETLDLVRLYLNDIGKHELLTGEQEGFLSLRMEKGAAAGLLLREMQKPKGDEFSEQKRGAFLSYATAMEFLGSLGLKDSAAPVFSEERKKKAKQLEVRRVIGFNIVDQDAFNTKKKPELFETLGQYIKEGKEAEKEMIEANLRLVVSIAKKFQGRGMGLLDIVQEGNLGLMHAVSEFNFRLGYRFSTFAGWWIRQNIQRAIPDQGQMIRRPVNLFTKIAPALRLVDDFFEKNERSPTADELTDMLLEPRKGADGKEIKPLFENIESAENFIKTVLNSPLTYGVESLDRDWETPDGNTFNAKQFIPAEIGPEEEDLVEQAVLGKRVARAVRENLNPRTRRILALRFAKVMTLEEIGAEIGLTRERVRQLERAALLKLRGVRDIRKLAEDNAA